MKQRKVPMRKCVACHTMKGKKELIRVVKSPDGEILLDRTGKKNGRELIFVMILPVLIKHVKPKH